MQERDLFVATVAIGLGAILIYSMILNSDWVFQMRTPKALAKSFGRNQARWILGWIGTFLILIGGHLIFTPSFQHNFIRNESQVPMDHADENDAVALATQQ